MVTKSRVECLNTSKVHLHQIHRMTHISGALTHIPYYHVPSAFFSTLQLATRCATSSSSIDLHLRPEFLFTFLSLFVFNSLHFTSLLQHCLLHRSLPFFFHLLLLLLLQQGRWVCHPITAFHNNFPLHLSPMCQDYLIIIFCAYSQPTLQSINNFSLISF